MKPAQIGAWSGIFATSTMTLGFLRFFKMLPYSQRSPLPPATLTSETLQTVGINDHLQSQGRENAALISHYGYGIASGILYSLLPLSFRRSPILSGLGFGCAVWGLSYFGWIPVFGYRASGPKMPANRNLLMLSAHLIWGATLGYAQAELQRNGRQIFDGNRKAIAAE